MPIWDREAATLSPDQLEAQLNGVVLRPSSVPSWLTDDLPCEPSRTKAPPLQSLPFRSGATDSSDLGVPLVGHGQGAGPWVMADLENGLWAGDQRDAPAPSINFTYVTAMAKGRKGGFALKGGNAQGGALQTLHEGARPAGYDTMKKQGAIILGIGGDNSCSAVGTFYEGAMTATYTDDAADAALQANIVAAGYGK